MHGLVFFVFIPVVTVAAFINLIVLSLSRKKRGLSFTQIMTFNFFIYLILLGLAYFSDMALMYYHDNIGCNAVSDYEIWIMALILLYPILNRIYLSSKTRGSV